MSRHKYTTSEVESNSFIGLAVAAVILVPVQLIYLQELKIFPAKLLPLLSICIGFDNLFLSISQFIEVANSESVVADNVLYSLKVPFFVVVMFETVYRLYESRSLQFSCIRFDQGDITSFPIWVTRMLSLGLLTMNLASCFPFTTNEVICSVTGVGGFASYVKESNRKCLSLSLSLIPAIILIVIGIWVGFTLCNYGASKTLTLHNPKSWRLLIISVILYLIGHSFNEKVFLLTSNAGEIALLYGVTASLYLIQKECYLASTYSDFLRSSNIAFVESKKVMDIDADFKLDL